MPYFSIDRSYYLSVYQSVNDNIVILYFLNFLNLL